MENVARLILGVALFFSSPCLAAAISNLEILPVPSKDADCVTIVGSKSVAAIVVDTNDFSVVQLAANFFADDVQRVSGQRLVVTNLPTGGGQMILGPNVRH